MDIIGRALTVPPPSEKVEAVKKILGSDGILDDRTHAFFLSVLEAGGLFWDPLAPKRTAREISRQAKAAALGEETEAWVKPLQRLAWPKDPQLRERWVTSLTHQTIRGKQIIPIGPHKRRRPEPEVTYAIQLMDCHLQNTTSKNAKARCACIAGVLLAVSGSSVEMNDDRFSSGSTPREEMTEAVRKRLARVPRALWDCEYPLALWRVDRKHDPDSPFPFRQRVPVELEPGPDGQIRVIPGFAVLAHGMTWERFWPLFEQALRTRRAAGPFLEPEVLWMEIDPPGVLIHVEWKKLSEPGARGW